MKVIVAGSRTINNQRLVESCIEGSGIKITTLISGHCKGVDQCAERWAEKNKVNVARFPADWAYGKSGGPKRNAEMAKFADAAIIIIDGHYESKGSRNMMKQAMDKGIPVHLYEVNDASMSAV